MTSMRKLKPFASFSLSLCIAGASSGLMPALASAAEVGVRGGAPVRVVPVLTNTLPIVPNSLSNTSIPSVGTTDIPPAGMTLPTGQLPVLQPQALQDGGFAAPGVQPGQLPAQDDLGARAQLDQANTLVTEQPKAEAPAAENRWRTFWSGSKVKGGVQAGIPGGENAHPSGLSPSKPGKPVEANKGGKLLGALAAVPIAPVAMPVWLADFFAKYKDYFEAGGVLIATHFANKIVGWGIDRIAELAHWKPNTKVAVHMAASIAVWTTGAAVGLHTAGAGTSALLATFGIGGVGVTMAVKDFVGNFIEGIKVLINQPFVMGDRIKLGAETYVVKDMTLRYLVLQPESLKGSLSNVTYEKLATIPITVYRDYSNRHKLRLARIGVPFRAIVGAVKAIPRPNIAKATLWMVVGVGALVGLPVLKASLAFSLFNTIFPYLQGAAVLAATHSVAKWLTNVVQKLGEKLGWNPQATLVVKIAAEALTYTLGGSFALRAVGLTWKTLLTTLGATTAALSWASADILSNLFHGIWLLARQPFKIGDTIKVGGVMGQVADMTVQYVVLVGPDHSHILVPQSVIKSELYTVLSPEDIEAAKAKLTPPNK